MSSDSLVAPAVSTGFDINAQFRSVMHELGLSPEDTGGTITFVGEDPIFPSVHRLGACISIPIMAGAAGIADIWRQRTGRGQDLTPGPAQGHPRHQPDVQIHAHDQRIPLSAATYFDRCNPMVFDLYRTKDGRFFLPTGAYPRMFSGMCKFLECAPDKESIAKAVSKWDSEELDEAAADKRASSSPSSARPKSGQTTLRASNSPKSRWWKSSRSVTAIPSRSHRRRARCRGCGCWPPRT